MWWRLSPVLFLLCCERPSTAPPPPSAEAVNRRLDQLAERREDGEDVVTAAALGRGEGAPGLELTRALAEAAEQARAKADAPDAGPAPDVPRPPRPHLPAPLKLPSVRAEPEELRGDSACLVLVDRVCELVTLAAEECLEARAVIRARPDAEAERLCQESLDFFRDRIDTKPEVKPCLLLGDLRCGALRSRSKECRAIRKAVKQLTKNMPEACMAEILISRGIPSLATPLPKFDPSAPPPKPPPPVRRKRRR